MEWLEVISRLRKDHYLFPQGNITGKTILQWRSFDWKCDPEHQLTSNQHLNSWLKDVLKGVNPEHSPHPFTFHSARVGGATALYRSSKDPALVQQMGSWKSSVFRTYLVLSIQEMTEATAILGDDAPDVLPRLLHTQQFAR